MAAIGLRAAILLALSALTVFADQAHEILDVFNHVATSLTDGDPSNAISFFSKSYSGYDTLRDYFSGLTSSYDISNEVNVLDEQDAADETKVVLEWSLNLTSKSTNENLRRSAEVHVRLVRRNHRWEIVDFSPITLFDPQLRPVGK